MLQPVYEEQVLHELRSWQKQMLRKPTLANWLAKRAQQKINAIIPEKVHQVITATIKQMIRAVLFGAEFTTRTPTYNYSLELQEVIIKERIEFYKKTAAAEGGITGAGGILLGLADFPLLLSLKLKMLYDIAALYGHNISHYKERLYLLYIFQLAFSSQEQRTYIYQQIINWEEQKHLLPDDIHQFDWRTFQQEYRDYIDLAKMAQLIPIIGAPVGAVVNYRLLDKLGRFAMNAYRMRWQEQKKRVGGNIV
ncbi:ABC transporter-associated protein EcsC [Adhaeribacter arboris]|uniref:ABC transporter-associated protein EcsC n=1 Tax=Adhaeribacter arboris TaxID=2072846 RepID=A0A2T2YD67_9BACT|nr:EcsC family protein [Adhaeribacter arboris]PSR53388.1 ABC transporter-associated protein EcsC [Adhaeribacter arboris]